MVGRRDGGDGVATSPRGRVLKEAREVRRFVLFYEFRVHNSRCRERELIVPASSSPSSTSSSLPSMAHITAHLSFGGWKHPYPLFGHLTSVPIFSFCHACCAAPLCISMSSVLSRPAPRSMGKGPTG